MAILNLFQIDSYVTVFLRLKGGLPERVFICDFQSITSCLLPYQVPIAKLSPCDHVLMCSGYKIAPAISRAYSGRSRQSRWPRLPCGPEQNEVEPNLTSVLQQTRKSLKGDERITELQCTRHLESSTRREGKEDELDVTGTFYRLHSHTLCTGQTGILD